MSKVDPNQPSNLLDRATRLKASRKVHPVKKVLAPKNKHLSWDRILKDNKASDSAHGTKGKKFIRNSKIVHKTLSDNFVNSTESPQNSFSSDDEPIRYRSRSVQCSLFDNISGSVKHKANSHTNSSSDMHLRAGSDNSNVFSLYNPVRTLQFLIKELNSKIKSSGKS